MSMEWRAVRVAVLATATMFLAVTANAAPIVYLRSTVAAPWGLSGGAGSNEEALDLAFGAGNWDDSRYETVNTATLFSASTSFIFMEGGDSNADELESFLGVNQATLEAWVNAGGRVFINAAPNEGDGMSLGFGGVTLNYADFSGTGTAVDATHPIFNGPHAPAGANYTGNWFTHASISGGGVTSLIADSDLDAALAELSYGSGLALFGGMTLPFFHNPDPNAVNLRANILEYAASAQVPEPASLLLLSGGVVAAVVRRRRSRG